jgi:hypothetical protein
VTSAPVAYGKGGGKGGMSMGEKKGKKEKKRNPTVRRATS